jgi:hypothetical protein
VEIERMTRKWRIGLFATLGLTALGAAFFLGTYRAYRYVPDFYEDALTAKPEEQREASQELSSRVTMLYSDTQQTGDWKALFTQDQINGWLAVDLVEKHGELLPPTIHDPRIEISPEAVTLALRIEDESINAVFSLSVEIYLAESNVVAFRLRKARAGALPIPMSEVLVHLTEAAKQLNLPLRWTQLEDDPVALLTVEPQKDSEDNVLYLDALELQDKEIFLSGRTMPAGEVSPHNGGAMLPTHVAQEIQIRRKTH